VVILNRLFPYGIQRVLLVNPPDTDSSLFRVDTAKRGRYTNYPPYGLMVLATHLRSIGIEVEILNLNDKVLERAQHDGFDFDTAWRRELDAALAIYSPDLVAVTCMFTMGHKALKDVCARCKGWPVAIGGVHVSNDIRRVLDDIPEAHFAFKGEGDTAFKVFINVVNEKKPLSELRQVVMNKPRMQFDLPAQPTAEEISVIPAYDLVPIEGYASRGTVGAFYCFKPKGTRFATVLSNRGCRAQCTFCSVRNFNGVGVRQRSISSVVDELEHLRSLGIEHIMWLDDDLYKDEARFISLADEIVRRNVGITWDATNGVIAYSCTEEVIAASEASGCIAVNIGMESGNREVLKRVKKPGTVENFLAAAEVFKRHPKIHVSVFLMIGFPQETWGMIQDTIKVAEQMDMDWYRISQLQPLPNTPIYDAMVAQGLIQDVGSKIRFEGGAFGKQAQREAGLVECPPFNIDIPAGKIPNPEELNDIWFYMNWRLNFARIDHETRPEKLEQLKAHLNVLSDVISPENAFALRALSRLEDSPQLRQRLATRLETSQYWRTRFEALGLAA
jgi:radical SAM superfamily enzyme YgiQ (UPF0313 family)